MTYGPEQARTYELDPTHALPVDEVAIWLGEMQSALGAPPTGRTLDVGAGTGLLSVALMRAGMSIVALEPSPAMVEQGLRLHDELARTHFVIGNAHDAPLFESESFDWIVSRQVLCHVDQPDTCFKAWFGWLKHGGHAIVVDGFWPPSSWSDPELAAQPFAALLNARPVDAALRFAGFHILRSGPAPEIDRVRVANALDPTPRYIVVARKD